MRPPQPSSGIAYGQVGDWGCAVCVRLNADTDFIVSPPRAIAAFDKDPRTSWCPTALPASVHVQLAPRTSFSSGSMELLGGNFSSGARLVANGRVRALRLVVEGEHGDGVVASDTLIDPVRVGREAAMQNPAVVAVPEPSDGGFVQRLTLTFESAWPAKKPGACVSDIALVAIPWRANPGNEP